MNRFKYESILFMESLVKALRAKQTNLESNKIFFKKRIERERERNVVFWENWNGQLGDESGLFLAPMDGDGCVGTERRKRAENFRAGAIEIRRWNRQDSPPWNGKEKKILPPPPPPSPPSLIWKMGEVTRIPTVNWRWNPVVKFVRTEKKRRQRRISMKQEKREHLSLSFQVLFLLYIITIFPK